LLARNVLVADVAESAGQGPNLLMESLERGVLHPESPGQLLDEELAVGAQEDLFRPQILGQGQAGDGRSILRHVVGGYADALGHLGHDLAARASHVDTDPGGPWVPSGRPVAADDQVKTRILRQYSHLLMPPARFSRSSSRADSFWWQPWHTPSTRAAAPTPFFWRLRSSYSSRSSSSMA